MLCTCDEFCDSPCPEHAKCSEMERCPRCGLTNFDFDGQWLYCKNCDVAWDDEALRDELAYGPEYDEEN